MPNSWNFGFDYAVFLKLVLLVYPLLWWQLYAMLLKTRSKKLPGSFMKKKKM
jgi:very-long-chain (3R)-3-hydroxyacyl-CoA dehydratase